MSVNSLSSSAAEISPPSSVVNISSQSQNGRVDAKSSNGSKPVVRPDSNESAKAAQATAHARTKASDNAQVLRFDADTQINAGNEGKVTGQQADQAVAKEPTQKQVDQALEVSNRLSTMQVRSLQFTASKEDGRTIIKVVDTQNDEVIRQIPSEEFVKMAERISDLTQQLDSAQGLLFESKV